MAYWKNVTFSRFTDLLDEPVAYLLTPITGYQDMTLVTLEESLKSVIHLFDGIERNVWIAKKNSQNPSDGLSQDESASIHLFTMQFGSDISFSHVLNKNLRSENREALKPWLYFLKLFLTALYKLPSSVQTVWRGVRGVDLSSKYLPGSKFTWWGVSSCLESREILESEQFLGTEGLRTLFSIDCKSGKSVVAHSFFKDAINEIILMPGSCFEVLKQVHLVHGVHIIFLREIQPTNSFVTSSFHKTSSLVSTEKSSDVTFLTVPNENSSIPQEQRKATICNGNICSHCGKCCEWYYDGDFDRDYENRIRGESYDILDPKRWHRRPNGTCCYYYYFHYGQCAMSYGLEMCHCA